MTELLFPERSAIPINLHVCNIVINTTEWKTCSRSLHAFSYQNKWNLCIRNGRDKTYMRSPDKTRFFTGRGNTNLIKKTFVAAAPFSIHYLQ